MGRLGLRRVSITLSTALPSGYKVSRVDTLARLCRAAVERFKPEEDGTTYCNIGVNHIATGMGYKGFAGLLANAMVAKMASDADFSPVPAEEAKRLADMGEMVVAGQKGSPHGHVAVVMPGRDLVQSGKWGKKAPVVANVGKSNSIFGANFAFVTEPKYYVWIREGFGNEESA